MKKLLLTLALLLLPSAALAQCNGAFPASNACGTITGGPPGPIPFSSITNPCTSLGAFTVGTGSTTQCSTVSGAQATVPNLIINSCSLGSNNFCISGSSLFGTATFSVGGTSPIAIGMISNYGMISFNNVISESAGLGMFAGASGDSSSLYLAVPNGGTIRGYIGGSQNYSWTSTEIQPAPTNTIALGDASHIFSNLYVNTVNATTITGAVSFADLPVGTSDTVLGYWGSTVVSAIGVNNCAGALTYSTSSHTFGCNSGSGSGSVTSVGSGYGLTGGPITTSGTLAVSLSLLTNSLGSNVTINSSSVYADGPSVAQGSTGTWWADGTITISDSASPYDAYCKLWDGTTTIASGAVYFSNGFQSLSLHGYLASPAGNIRISCISPTNTGGVISFNQTGNSKDSTISVHRVQ